MLPNGYKLLDCMPVDDFNNNIEQVLPSTYPVIFRQFSQPVI